MILITKNPDAVYDLSQILPAEGYELVDSHDIKGVQKSIETLGYDVTARQELLKMAGPIKRFIREDMTLVRVGGSVPYPELYDAYTVHALNKSERVMPYPTFRKVLETAFVQQCRDDAFIGFEFKRKYGTSDESLVEFAQKHLIPYPNNKIYTRDIVQRFRELYPSSNTSHLQIVAAVTKAFKPYGVVKKAVSINNVRAQGFVGLCLK